MNSEFSSDVTLETVEKLEKERKNNGRNLMKNLDL